MAQVYDYMKDIGPAAAEGAPPPLPHPSPRSHCRSSWYSSTTFKLTW